MNPNPSIDSLTLVYLKVDELEVKLDLYLPPDAHGTLPAIIVLHGGFLTVGDRSPSPFVPMWMLDMCKAKGIVFISADYRLLYPGTGFDEIEDMKALFRYLSTEVNAHLPDGVTIEPSKIAVAGVSAGAYIARLAALYAEPRPVAVLSLFGMGGSYFTDHFVAVKAAEPKFRWAPVSEEAVLRLGAPVPLAEDPIWFNELGLGDKLGRVCLVPWWWTKGNFLDHLVGAEGLSEKIRALPYEERAAAIPADVAVLFPELHIDANFPPTFLGHGEADTAVLACESQHTYEQLQKAGVRSELHIVPEAEHGFMKNGALAPEAESVNKLGFEFLVRELEK